MAGTRERILSTSLTLFAEQGFDGTSLQQIADRLGLTKAALYYHFRSKDDLLDALLTPVLDELESLIDAPTDDLYAWLSTYLDHLLAHRGLVAFVSRDLSVLGHPEFASRALGLQQRVSARLTGQEGTAELRGAIALGAINGAMCSTSAVDDGVLRATTLLAVAAVLGADVRG